MEEWRQKLLDNPPKALLKFEDWEDIIKYELTQDGSTGDQSGENNPFYGLTHTEETKKKISMAITGNTYKHTQEAKDKIAKARRGRKHSEETKRKMSESRMGNQNAKGKRYTHKKKAKPEA